MAQAENCLGYTGTAKALHWIIVALLIVQFVLAWTMPHIRRDTKPDTLINLHLSFGIVILAIAALRLEWRLTHAEPPPEHGLPPWQVPTARILHWLLYLRASRWVKPLKGNFTRLTAADNRDRFEESTCSMPINARLNQESTIEHNEAKKRNRPYDGRCNEQ